MFFKQKLSVSEVADALFVMCVQAYTQELFRRQVGKATVKKLRRLQRYEISFFEWSTFQLWTFSCAVRSHFRKDKVLARAIEHNLIAKVIQQMQEGPADEVPLDYDHPALDRLKRLMIQRFDEYDQVLLSEAWERVGDVGARNILGESFHKTEELDGVEVNLVEEAEYVLGTLLFQTLNTTAKGVGTFLGNIKVCL